MLLCVILFGMKYDQPKKLRKYARIIEYYRTNPGLSMAEVGKKFKLTRQRISQILQKHNGSKDSGL